MQKIVAIKFIVLIAALFFSSCYRSGSSSSDEDTNADTHTDTHTDTDTLPDIGVDSTSDIGTDTETATALDTESDPCAAMDAVNDGTFCNIFVGVYWDGAFCRDIYCGCAGADCERLYLSQQDCAAERSVCMEPCPLSVYPDILDAADDGCLCGNQQYQHCCPDGMDFCSCNEATLLYEENLLCTETEPPDF